MSAHPPSDPSSTPKLSALPRRVPRWLESLLRVPLVAKIAGANGIIVIFALGSAFFVMDGSSRDTRLVVIMAVALAGALLMNVALVLIALRPLTDLEVTANRIWRGDLAARVPRSSVADSDLLRVGGALNALLDGLTADRARLRAMASHVLKAGDTERARVARELHDSAAQTLTGLTLELSAATRANRDPELTERLDRARRLAGGVLDEIKMLAHTMYPRVLEDRDLGASLQHLARETSLRVGIPVTVKNDPSASAIPAELTSALYRVAQEAVNNAVRHGMPKQVVISVGVQNDVARLEVHDDGSGFDVVEAEERRPGMGIFTMRERAVLSGGGFEIRSDRALGTRVVVTIPIEAAVDDGVVAAAGPISGSGDAEKRGAMSK